MRPIKSKRWCYDCQSEESTSSLTGEHGIVEFFIFIIVGNERKKEECNGSQVNQKRFRVMTFCVSIHFGEKMFEIVLKRSIMKAINISKYSNSEDVGIMEHRYSLGKRSPLYLDNPKCCLKQDLPWW